MKIHRIRVRNFRGITEREIRPLPTGVTVVQGPNEIGKSSLTEALDVVFDELDSSSKTRIKALQPKGRDVGVEVEVEVESGPYRFTYMKRFLRQKATVLRIAAPRHETVHGREAHERVRSMLRETMDVALWRALRMQQGTAIVQPDLASASSLVVALDRAAGASPASERELDLFERVRREYRGYFTETGREGGVLRQARAAQERARASVDEATRRLTALEADVERQALVAADVARIERNLVEAEETARRRARDLDDVRAARSRVESCELAVQIALQAEAAARERVEARECLVSDVARVERERDVLASLLVDVGPECDVAAARHERARAELDKAERVAREIERLFGRRQREVEVQDAEIQVQLLIERRDRVQHSGRQAASAAELLERSRIDRRLLDHMKAQHIACERAAAVLAAGAPALELTPLRDFEVKIEDESRRVGVGETLSVTIPTELTVEVGDAARLHIRAGTSGADLVEQKEAADRTLSELLGAAGVADLEAAELAFAAREEAQRAIEAHEQVLAADLRDLTLDQLEQKIERYRQRIASYGAEFDPDEAAGADAERLRDEAEADLREARELLTRVREEVATTRDGLERVRADRHRLDERYVINKKALEQARGRLDAARATATDEALLEQLRRAQGEVASAQAVLAREREAYEARDPEAIEALAANAVATRQALVSDLNERRHEHTAIVARLRVQGEEGLHEQLQEALGEAEMTERDLHRLEARASAVRVLYETFDRNRDAAKRAYVAPLRDEIIRLARFLPGHDSSFQLDVDEELRIVSRTLRGVTLPFDSLSTGTREQLTLLQRLATCKIVAADEGVPLILDDALGYSDEQRLEAMGAIIGLAGSRAQVVVLTCNADRYRHIGGALTITLPEATEALAATA